MPVQMLYPKSFAEEEFAAWEEHYKRFECAHEETGLRRRVISGGGIQYVYQCRRCGEPCSNPLSHATVIRESRGADVPAFDNALLQERDRLRTDGAEEIKARFDKSAFLARYDEYLKSEAWAKKRSLVLKRAAGVCEGCRERPPTEVHHLTYEHVEEEFLFELVALCGECHERLSPNEEL